MEVDEAGSVTVAQHNQKLIGGLKMARMADAFMRGYQFVDNIEHNKRAEARQNVLQQRQDTQWQEQQAQLAKQQEQQSSYNEGVAKLINARDNAPAILNSWGTVQNAIENKDFSNKSVFINALNTIYKPELEARAAKNNLAGGKIVDFKPTPDGKGIFIEGQFTDKNGKTYTAPLTDGAGAVSNPGSEKDKLQPFSISDLLNRGNKAVLLAQQVEQKGFDNVLSDLAQHGGRQGAALALAYANQRVAAKANQIQYLRNRRDKAIDQKTKYLYDAKLKELENSGRIVAANAKNGAAGSGGIKYKTFTNGGVTVAINPTNPTDRQIVAIDPMTLQSWRDLANSQATEWAKNKATYPHSDAYDFKKYGGSRKQAISIKAQEILNSFKQNALNQLSSPGQGSPIQGSPGLSSASQGQEQSTSPVQVQGQSIEEQLKNIMDTNRKQVSGLMAVSHKQSPESPTRVTTPSTGGRLNHASSQKSDKYIGNKVLLNLKSYPVARALQGIKEGKNDNKNFRVIGNEIANMVLKSRNGLAIMGKGIIAGAKQSNKGIVKYPAEIRSEVNRILQSMHLSSARNKKIKKIIYQRLTEGSALH